MDNILEKQELALRSGGLKRNNNKIRAIEQT